MTAVGLARRAANHVDLAEVLLPPLVLVRWNASFRQFLTRSIARQYRASALGGLWAVFVPLITLGIYNFVFGTVMQSRWQGAVTAGGQNIPFTLYLFAGLIVVWILAQSTAEACGAVVQHANLVKRAVFPLEILPLTVVGNALFHSLINTVILLAATLIAEHTLPWTALLFPFVLLPYLLFVSGVSWFLAALGVFFRDLTHVVGLVVTAVMFVSPVFYSVDRFPPIVRTIVYFNPISFITVEARAVLLEGKLPNWLGLVEYAIAAWLIASLGLLFFRQARKNFADAL